MGFFDDVELGDLQTVVDDSLEHRATISTPTTVTDENQEDRPGPPIVTGPVPCLLTAIGEAEAQIAAAAGVKAKWLVKFRRTQAVTEGATLTVTGRTDGVSWARVVRVTGEHGYVGRLARTVDAEDVPL